jgi:hypothetical protein
VEKTMETSARRLALWLGARGVHTAMLASPSWNAMVLGQDGAGPLEGVCILYALSV